MIDSPSSNDICPICKSSTYLNPDMRFLVNPECYHKMCESCVNRIYALGPAPCPYPGCGKILRKNKFKTQVFEDISVEREVNVRQRVQRAFNKQQEDFESLDDYNNYLEEIEDIVFNLSNGIDVEQTEQKLQAYEQSNRSMILANSLRQKQDDEHYQELQALEMEKRKQMALMSRQLADDEQRIKKEGEKELLRRLAHADDGQAEVITKNVQEKINERVASKRKETEDSIAALKSKKSALMPFRRRFPDGSSSSDNNHNGKPGTPKTPFTPFNGDRQLSYLFTVQESYDDPWLEDIKHDVQYAASGFLVHNAYKQALVQAFMGLECDVQQEHSAHSRIHEGELHGVTV